jgi:hypothetical protein
MQNMEQNETSLISMISREPQIYVWIRAAWYKILGFDVSEHFESYRVVLCERLFVLCQSLHAPPSYKAEQ